MIEDDDILFLSYHESFIVPPEIQSDARNAADQSGPAANPHGNSMSTDPADKLPSSIGGYKVLDLLGKGGFGEVRVGEHKLTEEQVALKFLKKSEIQSLGAAARTNTEIQCLAALKHMNIIRLHQVCSPFD